MYGHKYKCYKQTDGCTETETWTDDRIMPITDHTALAVRSAKNPSTKYMNLTAREKNPIVSVIIFNYFDKVKHAKHTSPKHSDVPMTPPEARAISPMKITAPSSVISMSRAPRDECIRDLL